MLRYHLSKIAACLVTLPEFALYLLSLRPQFIGQQLSPDEIRGLQELFEAIDTDGSGTISLQELQQAVASRGSSVSEAELQKLISMADVDHNQEIDWKVGSWY